MFFFCFVLFCFGCLFFFCLFACLFVFNPTIGVVTFRLRGYTSDFKIDSPAATLTGGPALKGQRWDWSARCQFSMWLDETKSETSISVWQHVQLSE